MSDKDTFAEIDTEVPSHSPPTVGMDPLIGTVVDQRYRIKRTLGQGGFGVVYLAADEKLSRPVVIKSLLDDKLNHEWSVKKFKQEMEALARVDHPSIVGIFDSGQLCNGKPYIVLQYVEGISLRTLINRTLLSREAVSFTRAANLIQQIGRALGAAHQRGILHRDLKPENIMVQELGHGDEQVKIIDFGVAKVKDSMVTLNTGRDHPVGTVAYMSPEQLSVGSLTSASDVYSFSVIAYELLTGRRPLNPPTGFQLLELQRAGVRVKPSELRSDVSPVAEAIILKALSFDAGDRYQHARDFGDHLANALLEAGSGSESQTASPRVVFDEAIGTPTLVHSSETFQAVRPQRPRSKMPLIGAIVLAGLLLAVAVTWFALRPKSNGGAPATSRGPVAVAPERTLTYWLTVQQRFKGKDLGSAFQSSGQESYGTGWKFRFNAMPSLDGALYLLNEGPDAEGATEYNILFPTPRNNAGIAQINANQVVQSGWIEFVNRQGLEKLWIIWSAHPIPELDEVFKNAADHSGVIDPTQLSNLHAYLNKFQSAPAEAKADKATNRTLVKSREDVLVQLVELSHRAL